MRKSILIARSNMRKSKGQAAAIVVLVIISALLLDLWLMLSMDYKDNFDRYHTKLNDGHVTLVAEGNDEVNVFLSDTLTNDKRVSRFNTEKCMFMVGSWMFNGGVMNGQLVFLEKNVATTRAVGRIEIVEEGNYASGVYLPMLYKSKDISIGRSVDISIGSNIVTYTVCGFTNSVMMGSHNCSLTCVVMTADKYAELENNGYAPASVLCSIRLKNMSKNLNYEAELKSVFAKNFPDIRMASNCYAIVSQSRYISQMICSGIMSAMAFFVLLIALVVIVANIINYVQVNMKNLGALKAVGYTSGQLVRALMLQFLSLTLFAAIVGAGLAYCVFPALNKMMISQTGIPYAIRFLPLPILISLGIMCGAVALFVWLAARRIKKIDPIVALRSGVQTHNFKRNHIQLEKTKAPLNIALALKTTLSGMKYNITVCITMLVLSLVVVFSGLMTKNVIADMTPFVDLIVGETADDCINVQVQAEKDFLKYMNADSRVEKTYLFHSINVSHVGGAELMATLSDDFSDVNNKNVIYKGRFPRYGNEIAVAAKYAKEKGFELGNEIAITANGKTEKFIISGFTQITNNLGRDCLLTRKGYELFGELSNVSYYINLKSGTDVDAFNDEIRDLFKNDVNATINVGAALSGSSTVYVTLMTVIVIAILFISTIIIAFVLYLLVRTMLNNKKRDYGILKALGFTTKQLILQTAMSFMPSVIISTIVGLIFCSFIINPLVSLFLSGIGIVKCTFEIPIGFIAAAGFVMVALTFGIACLLSLKIKKISPKTLLTGE